MRHSKGFTLIELLIAVVIVSILAAIAIPSYANHVRKSNRALAEGALLELANKQQNYLLDARLYADTLAKLSYTVASDISTHYTLTITVDNAATPPTYTLTATPVSSSQLNDTSCGTLSVTNTGKQTISGSGTVADCW